MTFATKVEEKIRAVVHEAMSVFESEKSKVANDVRVAVAKAEADAKGAVEAAAPEVKAAVATAVAAVTDAVVAALKAHGL
jgi:hypothetical protein